MALITPATPAAATPIPWLPKFFQPAPPASKQLQEPAEIASAYRFWRSDILFSSIVAYALFYFVRKNLSVAMPVMEEQLGITKSSLGLFLTLHGLIYGVSKFANGVVGDRANARTFLVVGLVLSALCNVLFGLSAGVVAFGVIWMINGWFQGMGFPPCARLMTHWFPPRRLATVMSVWNISHSIGAGTVVVLCGYLVTHFHDWRLCFFVPAGIALAGAVVLSFTLRDTPPSVGLPEVEGRSNRSIRPRPSMRIATLLHRLSGFATRSSATCFPIATSGFSQSPTSSSTRSATRCSTGARRC